MRGPAPSPRRADLPGGLDPVHHRHAHVHQHHVGPVLAAQPDGLGAVGGARDDGDVGLRVEQRGEPGAHDLLVVGDERADHGAASAIGQRDVDDEAAALRGSARERATGDRRAVAHSDEPVAGGQLALCRPGPVVPDPELQRVLSVGHLDVDVCAGRVPPCVRQRLLDDAVGGEIDACRQRDDLALQDEPDVPAGVARRVDQLGEPVETRLRRAVGLAADVLAQDSRAAGVSR